MSESDPTLVGTRVVVTGSTRGLGQAIARDLIDRGASVVLNGTDAGRCEQLSAELGCPVVAGSVADERTAEALIEACCEAFGGIDAVVNNAGQTRDRMLSRMSVEEFDDVVAVHLRGSWLISRAAVRAMPDGGSIVNIVSGTALYGHLGQSNYAAAKGGLLGLTRALSLELQSRSIRVNAVSPAASTTMIEPLVKLAGDRADVSGLFGTPQDVAKIVSFLASPMSAGLTGQVLGFNGHKLSVWSHPSELRSANDDWDLAKIDSFVRSGERSQLNPDELGRTVLDLLGITSASGQPAT